MTTYLVEYALFAGTISYDGMSAYTSWSRGVIAECLAIIYAAYRYRDVSRRLCKLCRSQRMQQSKTAQMSGRGDGARGSIGSLFEMF